MKTPGPLRLVRGGPGNSPASYTSLDLWYSCRFIKSRLMEFLIATFAVTSSHLPDSLTVVEIFVPDGNFDFITHRAKSTLDSNGCQTIRGGVDQYLACAFTLCRALQHSWHSDDLSGAGCWHFAQIPKGFPFMWVRRLRGIKLATGLSQFVKPGSRRLSLYPGCTYCPSTSVVTGHPVFAERVALRGYVYNDRPPLGTDEQSRIRTCISPANRRAS